MEPILLVFVLSSTILFSAFFRLHSWISPKAMEEITGSLGWPIVGESFSFITEFSSSPGIHSFMKKRQERYGKVFKTFFLGRFAVFMTGREASKILLTGKYRMVSLNLVYTGQQVLGLTSLLQTTGEAHKRLRRLIAEPPSLDGLKKYFDFINTLAIETLDQWPGRTVLVLEEASTQLILTIEDKIKGMPYFLSARDRMYAMLDSIIAMRRTGTRFQQDFLASLIMKHTKAGNEEDDGDKLTDKQLKDNTLTLPVAGHDTTTAALTWLIKFLDENPVVLDQLR
ncbi:hypothetical protein P3X46_021496 [Hevea brasiliensis]|uniref:Cytochrome P450 n=1 Tax=Hevea brasiliensis TaxID=3981 RepID=A0ABQ9LIM3_HEVBR|nr:hypothetical protein P3X46_021496 [Hevea brasiliensis]